MTTAKEVLVKVDELKLQRTKYKTKITNIAKRLCNSVEAHNVSDDLVSQLTSCMRDFNDCHDDYCCIIECNEGIDGIDKYKVVNDMGLDDYQMTVENVYQKAMEKYKAFINSQVGDELSQLLELGFSRLESLCKCAEGSLPGNEDRSYYVTEIEAHTREVQDLLTRYSAVCSSTDASSWQVKVNSLILEADQVKRKYVVRDRRISPPMTTSRAAVSNGYLGDDVMFGLNSQIDGDLASFNYTKTNVTSGGSSFSRQHPLIGDRSDKGACDLHLKRITLPEFSGSRKDWPEFKAVWRELAESTIHSVTALAYELKRSLKGYAREMVQNIYITKPAAYELIWKRLCEHYDDVSASVQVALESLDRLKPVGEEDHKGLVRLVDSVEAVFSQLEELGQVEILSMRDIDKVTKKLPSSRRLMWIRKYHLIDDVVKLKPFATFMEFLGAERAAVSRLTEIDTGKISTTQVNFVHTDTERIKPPSCAVHQQAFTKHKTVECRDFLGLSLNKKYEKLKSVHACFNCLGIHRRDKCQSKVSCRVCGKQGHHYLLCRQYNNSQKSFSRLPLRNADSSSRNFAETVSKCTVSDSNSAGTSDVVPLVSSSYLSRDTGSVSLYAIYDVYTTNAGKMATVFCDNGSNTSYITHNAADRLHAKRLDRYTLGVTTMGNIDAEYETQLYEVSLRTQSGKIVKVQAFGMKEITGPVSSLDEQVLLQLFPEYDVTLLQRKSANVDILLGCDYFGLHPKWELSKSGENLSLMQGELGICVQGFHKNLKEGTKVSSNMVKSLHEYQLKVETYCANLSRKAFEMGQVRSSKFSACTMHCKSEPFNFAIGEELATEVSPKCGGCKCGKCPITGHSYSFKEEQELSMIRNNLSYDDVHQCWVTSYPWLIDPKQLPDNYNLALATLQSTERSLSRDPVWADKYCAQIQDMLNRKVARKLTPHEVSSWNGPSYYISHLAVHNPNSKSTPIRIVFNSSQLCKGISLNSSLAKGPDNYINNLMGLLLRWREEEIAFVGDIKKMFNSVHLHELEIHCHRFLWRELDTSRTPDIYAMTRVNMGDRPAPAISTEALYQTAIKFQEDSPKAAKILQGATYVDDIIDSAPTMYEALLLTQDVENMLDKGGFKIKCWQFSGEDGAHISSNATGGVSLLKGASNMTRVLGVTWNPVKDNICYQANVNFSNKKRGVRTGPNLEKQDIPQGLPVILTRRMVLEQVMSIFDPLGFLCPFTLIAKLYLRETWALNLSWDDALPCEMHSKWVSFFTTLFDIDVLQFPRCLKPSNAVGSPMLVLMSDGSDLAYGVAVYIRWQLDDDSIWCRLVFAKCRIAPVNKRSTPQMELNAAVMSKRARKVIEQEMRFDFDSIVHVVDSETVLSMLNKTSTRFKVYEGVRIGEIQAATGGDMKDWAWISGKHNTADWLTRGRLPEQLNYNTEWWNGPAVLYKPVSEWGLKFGASIKTELPGEKKTTSAESHHVAAGLPSLLDYTKFSSIKRVYWVLARIYGMFQSKSFEGGKSVLITPALLQKAEDWVVKDIQSSLLPEMKKQSKNGATGGTYSSLKPYQDSDGLWCVGQRVASMNPMTADSDPQRLLAYNHAATRLIMMEAHRSGHRGRNGTLAKFREKFWVTNGSKLAWKTKTSCQLCKLRNSLLLGQCMGKLPETRLKPSTPFCYTMVDFFGPYNIRGEVQKRTTAKAYGIIFTDLTMRAVHIEPVFGYDTSSFLLALIRFASIRGWPSIIYSDPGTQFVAASKELKIVWDSVDKTAVIRKSTENGLEWRMGPADSPWHQGAVESMVKAAKKAIMYAINNQRLSASEFITLCSEVSNTVNERPIGTIPGNDSDIGILTPNSLLLGRASAKNPLGWQPLSSSLSDRYHLVQNIAKHFWEKWKELCAPALLVQRKWHKNSRNLMPGDVVLVLDNNTLRSEYRLGLVHQVFPGADGKVRKVSVAYKNYKVGEKTCEYSGAKNTIVTRSVQRLALLVPVNVSD